MLNLQSTLVVVNVPFIQKKLTIKNSGKNWFLLKNVNLVFGTFAENLPM